MDASIVKDFQRLRVLTPQDLHRMDELVQDLTSALEETSKSSKSKYVLNGSLKKNCRKRRGRKRRPNFSPRADGGNFSEASESSVEESMLSQELRENAASTTQQSDSDDTVSSKKRFQGPLPNVPFATPLAESDSVTENFSPLRPHRRRRKCKRMAIDPEPILTNNSIDQSRRPPHVKPRVKTLEAQRNNIMEEWDSEGGKKRMGSVKDSELLALQMASMECAAQSQESSSSFSSSESDCGIFTNDEARDGDDEQSDFFHEPGPACGVPGIIPWWETGRPMEEEDTQQDKAFHDILTGSFRFMSPQAKMGFKARMNKMGRKNAVWGREMRFGRRRLKAERKGLALHNKPPAEATGLSTDKLTLWHGGSSTAQTGDVKRRRQTPPDSPQPPNPGRDEASSFRGECIGLNSEPIPESNIGNRMLQGMGWSPGQGLGTGGTGITLPIFAYRRPKRKGLGNSDR